MTPDAPRRPERPRWPVPLAVAIAIAALLQRLPRLLDGADPLPGRVDAIYVFPGDVPQRPLCAADLWRRGIAPIVAFSGGSLDRSLAALGDPATDAEVGARIARRGGVAAESIVVIDEGTSTWEDAAAIARWTRASGARSVVAVTSPLHARRARRSLRFALDGTGTTASVLACGPRLDARAWWWDEKSLVAVVVETAKTVLYEVRHFLPASLGLARG